MSYISSHYDKGLAELKMIQPCLETYIKHPMVLVEKDRSPVEALLDFAGVDALAQIDGLMGFAFRTQWGSWDTFTIRYKRATGRDTEWQKYGSGGQHPDFTFQIYLRESEITIGAARYDDLMRYAKANEDRLAADAKTADCEGNIFLVIPFDELEGATWFKSETVKCEQCSRKSTRSK